MRNLTMMTDLYELTMAYGYFKSGMKDRKAAFDVFFRTKKQSFHIFAGLNEVMDYIENFRFNKEDIEYLRSLKIFDEEFLSYLSALKFTGDIYGFKEGDLVFAGEPILTVIAPIIEAQIIETAVLTFLNHETLIATKAARIKLAANKPVAEFGARRAQGIDGAVYGARAAIIGGCNSTSNVLTGQMFDVPVSGTHAHSWVMCFKSEYDAFKAYADLYPDSCLLLVDTYDVLNSGLPNAIKVFKHLRENGHKPIGIRIDSGDLAYLSKMARQMLDKEGFNDAIIVASNDLDEYLIRSLNDQGAKIDSYGVGTKLITSYDDPSLGGVYKLCAFEDENGNLIPKLKISENTTKMTLPGIKTVYRFFDLDSKKAIADLIALSDETIDESKPYTLTHPEERWKKMEVNNYFVQKMNNEIFKNGKLVIKKESVKELAKRTQNSLDSFWDEYKRMDNPQLYKVDYSDRLFDTKNDIINEIKGSIE